MTDLDMEENLASAFMPPNAQGGQGIYALQAAVEMPPLTLGWNLVNYPIPQAFGDDRPGLHRRRLHVGLPL
ncbi:MAG: hypothetical protein R3A10_19260 [Caldilineaceae bacterium]